MDRQAACFVQFVLNSILAIFFVLKFSCIVFCVSPPRHYSQDAWWARVSASPLKSRCSRVARFRILLSRPPRLLVLDRRWWFGLVAIFTFERLDE